MRPVLVLSLTLLVAACGGGSDTSDAGSIDALVRDARGADASIPDAPTADAALTTTSTWTAAAGLPEAACVPWTLTDTSDPEAPVLADGVLTLANDADAEALAYTHGTEVLTMPATLVLEAQVRFGTSTSGGDSRSSTGLGFSFDDDRKNSLFIDDGVIFLLTAESTRGPAFTAPTGDAMHTYRLEVVQATGAIEVFRDDVSVLTGTTFTSPYAVDEQIWWGEASIVAHGSSAWGAVTHNALTAVACP